MDIALSRSAGVKLVNPLELLHSHHLFSSLDEPDLEALANIARPRTWAADTKIFLKGDLGSEMILIHSGRVRLSISSGEGRELMIPHPGQRMLFGEIAVLDGVPRTADAVDTNRSKVNRAFSDLEAAGAIERRAGDLICRVSVLERIIGVEGWDR